MYEEEMYPSDPTERILYLLRKLSRLLDALPVTKFHFDDEPLNEEGMFSNDPGERVICLWRKFSRMLEALLKANFDPEQPRDAQGQWTCVDVNAGGKSGMDIDKAVAHLNENARSFEDYQKLPKGEKGKCATYVRNVLYEGGIEIEPKKPGDEYPDAKDYGPYLTEKGFVQVTKSPPQPTDYSPKKGDIAVFQPPTISPSEQHVWGHIQMYNGEKWVSDFKQPHFWPSSSYRINNASYAIYRP